MERIFYKTKGYQMKFLLLVNLVFLGNCIIDARIDWDNNDKPEAKESYVHPHEGNFTKIENLKKSKPNSNNTDGYYKTTVTEGNNSNQPNDCVSTISKCLSNCSEKYDINSSIFAFKVAFIRVKRSICYDECYNNISPGCDYNLKRIQY